MDGGITGAMVKRLFAGAQTRNAAAFAAQPNVIMAWDRIRQFEQTAARHRTLGKVGSGVYGYRVRRIRI